VLRAVRPTALRLPVAGSRARHPEDASVTVAGRLVDGVDRLHSVLFIERAGRPGTTRAITGGNCAEVIEGTALIIAVLLPQRAKEQPAASAAPTDAVEPAAAPPTVEPSERRRVPEQRVRPLRWRLGGGASGALVHGIAPGVLPGVGAFGDLSTEWKGLGARDPSQPPALVAPRLRCGRRPSRVQAELGRRCRLSRGVVPGPDMDAASLRGRILRQPGGQRYKCRSGPDRAPSLGRDRRRPAAGGSTGSGRVSIVRGCLGGGLGREPIFVRRRRLSRNLPGHHPWRPEPFPERSVGSAIRFSGRQGRLPWPLLRNSPAILPKRDHFFRMAHN
jgi:hypothetical protein